MIQDTYILQKDLPDSKAGDRYVWNSCQQAYYKNGNVLDSYWQPEHVINNSEWFLKEEQKIKISDLHCSLTKDIHHITASDGYYWYQFKSSHPLEEKSNSAIIKAIEFVVNDLQIKK